MSLDLLQEVNVRIATALNPQPSRPPVSSQTAAPGNPQPLPRLTAPLKQGEIFSASPQPATRPEMVQAKVGAMAKAYGQGPVTPPRAGGVNPQVKRLLEYGVDKALTPKQKQALSQEGRTSALNGYLLTFLQSPLGAPFRQTLRRRSAAIVLGTPSGDGCRIADALQALTNLAVCSLQEDPYGKVQADVPMIIRILVNTINNLNTLKRALQPHWTDVAAARSGSPESNFEDVDLLLQYFTGSLTRFLRAFGAYADVLGLGQAELRMAREVAGLAEGDDFGEDVGEED